MAYEFKKLNNVDIITEVDDSINLVVEHNGNIKRMNIANIPQRAQADWDETNEESPAYILNKPDEFSSGGSGSSSTTITYFIASGSAYKVGENWPTAEALTQDVVISAFEAGIVRLKYADDSKAVCTLLSYAFPSSGSGNVYFIGSDGTLKSFSV